MASTASTLLKIELQATGENSSTWGTKANTAMSRLEEAIADITNVSLDTLGGAGYTLDDTQYAEHVDGSNTSESHVAVIKATGVLSAAEQITVPLRNKVYWVWNATTGSFAVTVGGATGTTIEVPQGSLMAVICDGTNVVALTRAVTIAGALATAIAVAEGGTGATTAAGARTNLGLGDAAVSTVASIKSIEQNSQSAAYTTVLTDAGKHIYHPSADTTARIWTIDSNANVAYPIGTAITFINDTSGGVITIAITSDTLVLSPDGTTGSRTLAANGSATAIKVTSTRWIISGSGLT